MRGAGGTGGTCPARAEVHEPRVRGEPRLRATADDQSAHSLLRRGPRKRHTSARENPAGDKTAGQRGATATATSSAPRAWFRSARPGRSSPSPPPLLPPLPPLPLFLPLPLPLP